MATTIALSGKGGSGKTTLANRICKDWIGEEMGSVSNVAHETREIQIKEQISMQSKPTRGSLIPSMVLLRILTKAG